MGMFEERIFKAEGTAGPRVPKQDTPDMPEDKERGPKWLEQSEEDGREQPGHVGSLGQLADLGFSSE